MSRKGIARSLAGLLAQQQSSSLLAAEASTHQPAALTAFSRLKHGQTKNSIEGKVLHPELLNNHVLKTQYAVRGELYLRAEELRKAGKEIIFTNGERVQYRSAHAWSGYILIAFLAQSAILTRLEPSR